MPLDLETAKAIVSATPQPDPISPSVGAASMIEPQVLIENPFSEPSEKNENVHVKGLHATRALTLSARHREMSAKADQINDQEYDQILTRMVAQNRKINQDPKAVRRSAIGMGKLRKSFERLQMSKHAKSEAEAEGVGPNSHDFGLELRETETNGLEMTDEEAEQIDWDLWGGLINGMCERFFS